ncbi:MAG: FHA domain-containing protein, partial [Anaerolineae bacterium]
MLTEMAMLMEVEGPSPGKRFFLEQTELTIGRDESCDLVIPERQVSRQHARIRHESGRHILE